MHEVELSFWVREATRARGRALNDALTAATYPNLAEEQDRDRIRAEVRNMTETEEQRAARTSREQAQIASNWRWVKSLFGGSRGAV